MEPTGERRWLAGLVVAVTLAAAVLYLSWRASDPAASRAFPARGSERGTPLLEAPQPTPKESIFMSIGNQDGRIWSSTSSSGGQGRTDSRDATGSALRVGDLRGDLEYRSILSFDTSPLPDGAKIRSATLRLKRGAVAGMSPFDARGRCWVDVRRGAFGLGPSLEPFDFGAPGTAVRAAHLREPRADGAWAAAELREHGMAAINPRGLTQVRIYFSQGDGDGGYDYVGFFSGDSRPEDRPRLVVAIEDSS